MFTERLMQSLGWESVWAPDAGDRLLTRPRSYYVGTWTGPDHDLLCVRRCETSAEAERCLSPVGHSILFAAVRSLMLLSVVRWEDSKAKKGQPNGNE